MKKETEMRKKQNIKMTQKKKRPIGPTPELGWPVPRAGVCGAGTRLPDRCIGNPEPAI
jgi:hypothetical protein